MDMGDGTFKPLDDVTREALFGVVPHRRCVPEGGGEMRKKLVIGFGAAALLALALSAHNSDDSRTMTIRVRIDARDLGAMTRIGPVVLNAGFEIIDVSIGEYPPPPRQADK